MTHGSGCLRCLGFGCPLGSSVGLGLSCSGLLRLRRRLGLGGSGLCGLCLGCSLGLGDLWLGLGLLLLGCGGLLLSCWLCLLLRKLDGT